VRVCVYVCVREMGARPVLVFCDSFLSCVYECVRVRVRVCESV